jgi:hypothetical protein
MVGAFVTRRARFVYQSCEMFVAEARRQTICGVCRI